jgi:hypothetical protein
METGRSYVLTEYEKLVTLSKRKYSLKPLMKALTLAFSLQGIKIFKKISVRNFKN